MPKNNKTLQSNLTFRVSSGLKDIIGRDLIFDANIAVFELVKNSFDAHAKEVEIIFDTDKIVIKDNGKGMSYKDIQDKWLFVAYSAKKERVEDVEEVNTGKDFRNKIQQHRHYAGAKGIGRFSCDRLGANLKLITKSVEPNSTLEQIEVNWEDFQKDAKQEFIKIPVRYSSPNSTEYKNFQSGTILEITNLRSIWKHDDIIKLKRSLEKLVNPFGSNKDDINAFSIKITAGYLLQKDKAEKEKYVKEHSEDKEAKFCQKIVNGKVQNFVFETLNVKTTQIYTQIDKKGEFLITELIDRDILIFKIREENPYKDLKNIHFHLFYLNRAAKANFTRRMKVIPNEFGSIFLFKNGFRVFPYGQSGDDSFGIDRRKQQGYARNLGTRDLLGRIDIIGDNQEFRETSSRSGGLINTPSFEKLKVAFDKHCIKRLQKYVVEVQWAKAAYRELDKDSSNISTLDNIEAKTLILNVIDKIIRNKGVELLDYDKGFLSILDEKLHDISPQVFADLRLIAEKTKDKVFFKEILKAEKEVLKLQENLRKEEEARLLAEEKAKEAELRRVEAEKKAKIFEEAKKIEENKRLEEEIKRKRAEQKELEEIIRRKRAEKRILEEEEAKKKAQVAEFKAKQDLKVSETKNLFLSAIPRDLSPEGQGLVHHIHMETQKIDSKVSRLLKMINNDDFNKQKLFKLISGIKLSSDKTLKISSLITRANFNKKANTENNDLAKFVIEYVGQYKELNFEESNINFHLNTTDNINFFRRFSVLEVSIILDNLISNSKKASKNNNTNIYIDLKIKDKTLLLTFSDDGIGIATDREIYIFDLGITTTHGSGIGLYIVKDILESKMKSHIDFIGNRKLGNGATFKITFTK